MDSATIIHNILFELSEAAKLLPRPLEAPYSWVRRQRGLSRRSYGNALYSLKKRGLIKVVKVADKEFLKVTEKGQMEILMSKSEIIVPKRWDGKWRIIMFDIPEGVREKRNKLRRFLKKSNFYKLQASVFIHPYALNREAVEYLRQSGLINYIRMMRIEEMDDDTDLEKKFKVKKG
jgi:DNA-binding transcriptional regulator PaaX